MSWLPSHGHPHCAAARVSQVVLHLLALLPVYIAVVVTLTLVVVWISR